MKKILVFSLLLVLISAAASAQRSGGTISNLRPQNKQITWGERKELRKDAFRYHRLKRKTGRDGRVTPIERRRLHRAKYDTRRDAFRFRHNSRRRVI